MVPDVVGQLGEQFATDPKFKGVNPGTPGLRWKMQKVRTIYWAHF